MIEVVLSLVAYGVNQRKCMIGKAWGKVAPVGSIAPVLDKGCVQRHPADSAALCEWRTRRVAYTWFMLIVV